MFLVIFFLVCLKEEDSMANSVSEVSNCSFEVYKPAIRSSFFSANSIARWKFTESSRSVIVEFLNLKVIKQACSGLLCVNIGPWSFVDVAELGPYIAQTSGRYSPDTVLALG